MAKLKVPQTLLKSLHTFLKQWLTVLVQNVVRLDNNSGYYLFYLEQIRDYLEPLLPLNISEALIEEIFNSIEYDSAFKMACLRILHFPERGTKLNLGKLNILPIT